MKKFTGIILALVLLVPVAQAGPNEDLMLAARQGDVQQLQKLIAAGADVNFTDEQGLTPLLVASRLGNRQTVRLLLAAGADITVRDRNGTFVLLAAVYSRNELLVSDLVALGVDVNARDPAGATPLTIAGRLDYDPVIEILRAAGAEGRLLRKKLRSR